ncbi:MAG: hypothetical protein B7Z79_04530 [Thiomonas sp. 20-64-9]|jgi:hypothetical protein|uniref:hypothetical protein n=1 Tax=unclassified Thiomonas TaxID=2625466 RepID=UPI000BDD6833|nr:MULTISPECIES: hypothetical protein [unclassified Thiomonas]OYV30981.1 MAG: hypothetical protein B7Z79_04530 [Thiomonas sp. 20-64-9]
MDSTNFTVVRLAGSRSGIPSFDDIDRGNTAVPLTDPAVRNAKPSDKPRKLPDETGLYLMVKVSISKQSRA